MATRWTAADIPSQSGKVAVVTGANSGLGLSTARELVRAGASVVAAVRDVAKGESVASEIRATIPDASIEVLKLDLGDLTSVRDFAERLGAKQNRLDLRQKTVVAVQVRPPCLHHANLRLGKVMHHLHDPLRRRPVDRSVRYAVGHPGLGRERPGAGSRCRIRQSVSRSDATALPFPEGSAL